MRIETEPAAPLEAWLLGGVGEFGMNMMALRSGATTLLIDAGIAFPGPDQYGVDIVVPAMATLPDLDPVSALILTHGHEDHVGAVPYIWDLFDGPVYGTRLTLALLSRKLAAHGLDEAGRLVTVEPADRITVGDLEFEFVRVAHSIPDAVAVAIHTPVGTVVHTGDYKFDAHPLDDRPTDTRRFAELGREGVVALFADSTNATYPGRTGAERDVLPALEALCAEAPRRVFITTFASSLHRLQILVDLAGHLNRQVAFIGRGIVENVAIAERLGYLRIPVGLRITEADVARHPPERILCIITGSQGEPLAAVSRLAAGTHRHLRLDPGDLVIFSARAIPANQGAIDRVANDLVRRGARVVDGTQALVHVSGHGSADDIKEMLSLVRPRFLVPIHGEYRKLVRHTELAVEATGGAISPLLAENGDRVCFDGETGWIGPPVGMGRLRLDETRAGAVDDDILRHRRHIASGGLVVAVVVLDARTGRMRQDPQITTRGLVLDADTTAALESIPELLRELIDMAVDDRDGDEGVTERLQVGVQRMIRRLSGRRPLVVPVVVEI